MKTFTNFSIKEIGEDRLVWALEDNGEFSIKGLKCTFNTNWEAEGSYQFEWNNLVAKKVGILAWRAEMERIPTLFSLLKRSIMVASVVCSLCEEEVESAEHLFVSCPFAQSVWSIIDTWCKVPAIFTFSVRDLLEMHKYSRLPKRMAKAFHAVCLTTIWCIRKTRNSSVFERKPACIRSMIGEVKALSFLSMV
ncbi:uncharacterized protein LOC143569147 [Bidens hawaiensis]|uniref:uncharacterized protein LOC143569147 n=1 Tax=Bidens hawaiensis TaxID=980011 RepID=UPI00404AD3C3